MKIKRQIFFLLGFLVLCFSLAPLQATHIVGGVINYECLGRNAATGATTFRINMRIYRDAINGQAAFDNPAAVGIYAGNNLITPYAVVQMRNPLIRRLPVDVGNPCLVVPPNILVEEGVYTADVVLPFNAAGYHIAYQRCCRNNTINNLVNPGAVGATYTVFITGLAQQVCNSSPVYRNFPPLVICQNQPLNFDHSATDANGHRLTYELCHSYLGGTTTNPAPSPPSPPNYGLVPFAAGFSATNPLTGSPGLSINPNTGLLTGVPTRLGQFVVGICVREFDANNQLLSVTLRDFQFNVAFCEEQVRAAIQADSVDAAGNRFVRNVCGNRTVSFVNQSGLPAFITGYQWRFFNAAGTQVYSGTPTNATVTFPAFGAYTGILVANPGQQGCTDTAFINVNVFPPLTANFNFAIDSCNPSRPPIQFSNSSTVGGSNIINSWTWAFGDGQTTGTTNPNPAHQYNQPGNYTVNLTVRDNNNCVATTTRNLQWFPPATANFSLNRDQGCAPLNVQFSNTSTPFAPSYTLNWNFGDGSPSSTNATVGHTYTLPGRYRPSLRVTSPWGCQSLFELPDSIEVYNQPVAAFAVNDTSCAFAPLRFEDRSSSPDGLAINQFNWAWGDGSSSTGAVALHQYASVGDYTVTLSVTDAQGCQGQFSRLVRWYPSPNMSVQPQFSGCRLDTLRLTNNSNPSQGYSHLWTFGDGNSATTPSAVHAYQQAGNFNVRLVMTSPTGCTGEYNQSFLVRPLPRVSFTSTYDSCIIDSVTFLDNSLPNTNGDALVSWAWTFNDGTTSNRVNPRHLYRLAGFFPVLLEVTDVNGCVGRAFDTISWFPAPIIDVRIAADTGCTPFPVFFDNQSYPINGYSTNWQFGDGGSSPLASPTHTYTRPGRFPVHLVIISPRGCRADFRDTVMVFERPRASFSHSFDSCAFEGVNLVNTSSSNAAGTPLRFNSWNFGQGSTAQNLQDTLFPYTPRANYQVVLVVEDENACRDTFTRNIAYFPAPVFPVPSHNMVGCIPQTVVFDNNPLNNFPGYTFDWNLGPAGRSNAFDTTVVYETPGIFFPTLRVRTPAGCEETFRDTLYINGLPQARIGSDFDVCSEGPVRFRNLSLPYNSAGFTQVAWNFGDGNTGSLPIERHQYAAMGTYTVSLRVTDSNGCSHDTTEIVEWEPRPVYPLNLPGGQACLPVRPLILGNNPYPIPGYTLDWDFGQGNRSNAPDGGGFVYTQPGQFTRRVIIVSPAGCRDTFTSQHNVLPVPRADFSYSPNPILSLNPQVQFQDQSVDAAAWFWNFDREQGRSFLQNPAHSYSDTGLFNVRLVVTHLNGCKDSIDKALEIIPRITYFLPNAFTPNGDGVNDEFRGTGILDYLETFEMSIYNRWGERIFVTESPYEGWNGRKHNNGERCQAGVYVVVVRLRGPRGEEQEIKGFATLVE